MTQISGPAYNNYAIISYQSTSTAPVVTSISATITFNQVALASGSNNNTTYFNMLNCELNDGTPVYLGLHEPGVNFPNNDGTYTNAQGTADLAVFSNGSAAAPNVTMHTSDGSQTYSFVDGGQGSLRAFNTNLDITNGNTYTLTMTLNNGTLTGYVTDQHGHTMEVGYATGLTATSFDPQVLPGHEFTSATDSACEPSDDVIVSNIAMNGSTQNVYSSWSNAPGTQGTDPFNGNTQYHTTVSQQCTSEIGGDYMETASGSGINMVHLAGTGMNITGGNSNSALQVNSTYHDLTSDFIANVPILDMNCQTVSMTATEYSGFTTFENTSGGVTLTTAGTIGLNASIPVLNITSGTTVDVNNTNPNNVQINSSGTGNIVVFDGNLADYNITVNPATNSVTVVDSYSGRDGTLVLTGVQELSFHDTNAFVVDGTGATVAELYTAALNRQPDVGGIAYWENTINTIGGPTSANITAVAQCFLDSNEFVKDYGTAESMSSGTFLTQMYQNALHRAPDAPGLAWWEGQMAHGVTEAQVLVGFAQSAENLSNASHWIIPIG
jgi:hypothetical protein